MAATEDESLMPRANQSINEPTLILRLLFNTDLPWLGYTFIKKLYLWYYQSRVQSIIGRMTWTMPCHALECV